AAINVFGDKVWHLYPTRQLKHCSFLKSRKEFYLKKWYQYVIGSVYIPYDETPDPNEELTRLVENFKRTQATIFLTDGTKDTENLDVPEDLDSDRQSEVDELIFNAHTNENDILNLEEDQRTKNSHINNYFKISKRREKNKQIEDINNDFENNEKTNRLLSDLQSISTHDQFSIDNINQPDNEYVNDNLNNIYQPDNDNRDNINQPDNEYLDNEYINDNRKKGLDVSDYDSPGWSECEECYGNKGELCEYCDHILLCDGPCGKNFHTGCLNPPLKRISPENWYCKECNSGNSKKLKRKMRLEYSSLDEISAQKDKRLKSKSVKKYKTPQDTLDSDDDDSKNIRKFSKTKTTG
ncbi:16379_t:CDS:2, partial [Racocetra fulgida]